ncbi:hypothetical protein J6524_27925 [Bradyrhizobium sp. WSM 1738]|uniref:hypothetical protein n=1 Tax=Bradyrhizobium hereditatis TaxID=2821405 RepID=UPI001CE2C77F|nr:hypothetical protein [Bradyrhizobium hereditatis]MCA6118678.1 hypothetical protein [Bradyrhizobium hereditatis]
MLKLGKSAKYGAALAAVALYFSIALWLERSYVSPVPKGQVAVQMRPPFEPLGGAAFRYLPSAPSEGNSLMAFAEDPANAGDRRSPIIIYEGHHPLGPAHSTFENISRIGRGHFAHWTDQGFVFSTSDGSDPNRNGRLYWLVIKG